MKVRSMQRSGTEAIRTQLQPSKPKQEITNITNRTLFLIILINIYMHEICRHNCQSKLTSFILCTGTFLFRVHVHSSKWKWLQGEKVLSSPIARQKYQHKHLFPFVCQATGFLNMILVVRKPVFGVSDQAPHKLGCAATEDG